MLEFRLPNHVTDQNESCNCDAAISDIENVEVVSAIIEVEHIHHITQRESINEISYRAGKNQSVSKGHMKGALDAFE